MQFAVRSIRLPLRTNADRNTRPSSQLNLSMSQSPPPLYWHGTQIAAQEEKTGSSGVAHEKKRKRIGMIVVVIIVLW